MKKDPHILGLRLPPDLRQWIRHQKALLNTSETDIATDLLIRGLQAKTVDEIIAGIRQASSAGLQREMLRQTLVTRYIVEAQAKGAIRHPETLGTEANAWADNQLNALFPKGENHDDQPER